MNIVKHLLVTITLASAAVTATAQGGRNMQDSVRRYYNRLSDSESPADKALLESKLYPMLQSSNEEDWLTARGFFFRMNKNNTVDSINTAAIKRFPLGQVARSKEVNLVYEEKDPAKKEEAFKKWIAKFPSKKDGNTASEYDYARFDVAVAYALDSNLNKALEYAHQFENKYWKSEGEAGTAKRLIAKGFKKEGFELYLKARSSAAAARKMSNVDRGADFAADNFLFYSTDIARMLLNDKKPLEAYSYVKPAYDSAKQFRPNTNAVYFDVLLALDKKKEAFEVAVKSIEAGQPTPAMKSNLKALYVAAKGSVTGYDDYVANINKRLSDKLKKETIAKMVDMPAPDVRFTDVNGKPVSLNDIKGKVVVLDFWATWCGPCKRSFPAMKMAVEKYKDNDNVKFIFIHTWEKTDKAAAIAGASQFITQQKYPFEVWMDLKDDRGANNGVVGYKITGIPAKFVIDKRGHIRFAMSGFSGTDEAAVEELSLMIDMAAKG